jgi:Ca2+-binding RTX toxin-like protein
MAINLPNGLLKLLGIGPSTIEISLGGAGDSFNGTNANEHILGNGGGDSINAGGGSDIVEGGAGGDSLNGQDGNDYVEGGIGGDAMNGGAGIDTLGYSQSGSSVKVTLNNSGGGTTSGSGSGPGNHAQGDSIGGFENIVGSNFNDTLTGNNLVNVLAGLAGNDKLFGMGGNDVLVGGVGADVLDGGAGTDTADYSTSASPVHLVLGGVSSGGDAAGDTFISIENFVGTAGADVFDGSASLTGFSADGGGGADSMFGGHGNDRLSLGGAALAAGFAALQEGGGTLNGGEGDDTLDGGGQAYDDGGTFDGGEGNDVIYGGGGNDTILDGTGDDTASGGDGDDTFFVSGGLNDLSGDEGDDSFVVDLSDPTLAEDSGDIGYARGGGGNDTYYFGHGSAPHGSYDYTRGHGFALADALDEVVTPLTVTTEDGTTVAILRLDDMMVNLTEIVDNYTGNDLADRVNGRGDNDTIDGAGGDDDLSGGEGNDLIFGGDGFDWLKGDAGDDTLVVGLKGEPGPFGSTEILEGGEGADRFYFGSVEEAGTTETVRIFDFDFGSGDFIDLATIDAVSNTAADDAFTFIGDVGFSGAAGELRFEAGTGTLDSFNFIRGDVDGDGLEDFSLCVNKSASTPTDSFFSL